MSPLTRLLLLLLGMLSTGRPPGRYLRPAGAGYRPGPGSGELRDWGESGEQGEGSEWGERADRPAMPRPPRAALPGGCGRPPRRRWHPWLKRAAVAVVIGVIFRRAVASVALSALAAGLHLAGISAHLPSVRFGWPWQAAGAGGASTTDPGPWVLQKIQGISRPALGQANFGFLFTHKVSKNIGPWPCWYASTFYAVGHAAASVDLNPGASWWAPARGHYRMQLLSRPQQGKPGHVSVTMVLPQPQLPQSAHDVSIDNLPSRPVSTQHSWTYPGLGCGVLLHPQFPQSELYAQAQRIAFYKATHSPQVTRSLITTAENQARQTIRDNFIQPTVNAFGYRLDQLTLRWAAAP